MSVKLKTLLSIAGSDPTGGAGIQADLRVGSSLGFHVATAITSVTVQNSKGLSETGDIPPVLLQSQLDALLEDMQPDAIKIGMIGSLANGEIISEFIKNIKSDTPIVIDPVLFATSNHNMVIKNADKSEVISFYKKQLFPFATVITPNYNEFLWLAGVDKTFDLFEYNELQNFLSFKNLIITGDCTNSNKLTERLVIRNHTLVYEHPKVNCTNLHGTGCVYSSLLACFLANENLIDAFNSTNEYMHKIIKNSCDYTLGNSIYGPLNINTYRI